MSTRDEAVPRASGARAGSPRPLTSAPPTRRGSPGKARHRRDRGGGRRRPGRTSDGSSEVTWRARLRYRFDQTIAKGSGGVIVWLGVVTLVVIVVAATIAVAVGRFVTDRNDGSWLENAWQAMLRAVDAGTFAGDRTWPVRVLGLVVSLAGIFIAGSLIGLIASAVDRKVDDLSKGRGRVIESDHTLVLGWNGQVLALVNELIVANENQPGRAIVFLVTDDKDDVDQMLADRIRETKGTRLVVRSGDRSSPADLLRVSISTARSVVVLSSDDGDPGVVKALLAIRSVDPHFDRPVVAEISDHDVANSVRALIGGVVTVNPDAVVAEVTAQACRQVGLSYVFKELLNFDGDEIYIDEVDGLAGNSYGFVQQCFAKSAVIGMQCADGSLVLNPPPSRRFAPGDRVVAITSDDDTLVFSPVPDAMEIVDARIEVPRDSRPLRLLMMGWSKIGEVVLRELDEFVAPGTRIDVVVDADVANEPDLSRVSLRSAQVTLRGVPGSSLRVPDDVAAEVYDQLIVLGYRDHLARADADSRTLLTLLGLRRAFGSSPRLVGQILDPADVDLAATIGADDLVVSDNLGCLMVAQLSENPTLDKVFKELFEPSGAYVTLAPAQHYTDGESVPFNDIVRRACERTQTAIGYRMGATGEVVLNPDKSDEVFLSENDHVVVLAGTR